MGFSYDIIGEVAILEIPKGSDLKPERAAREIRKTHPRVKTILQKRGERGGELRLRSLKRVFGNETETLHKEHGFRFRLDPTKVYFSPREATEREYIASRVRPGETVMVMFAGVGPFGIVIAGKQPGVSKVYQVEINPAGFRYMKQNISMNKLSHKVVPIQGDVRKVCRRFEGSIDRVLMPLPRDAHRYLGSAMGCLKKKGKLHFYSVGRHGKGVKGKRADEEVFGKATEQLRKAASKSGRSVRVLERRKVLPYSPGAWKICIDAEILQSARKGN